LNQKYDFNDSGANTAVADAIDTQMNQSQDQKESNECNWDVQPVFSARPYTEQRKSAQRDEATTQIGPQIAQTSNAHRA